MRWSDINRSPTPATLRQFALLWLLFFLGLAAWYYFGLDRQLVGMILALLALTVGLAGLAQPAWVRWVFVGWLMLTFPIGWTVSQLVLLLLFFGLFTPLALLFRITGRDPLGRKGRSQDSLWQPKPPPADVHSYFRQS
jgi:hypothetical protein